MKRSIYIISAALIILISAVASAKFPDDDLQGIVPEGLSATEWVSIQEQIETGKYRAYENQYGGFISANPKHGWTIQYDSDGTTMLWPRGPARIAVGIRLATGPMAICHTPYRHLCRSGIVV